MYRVRSGWDADQNVVDPGDIGRQLEKSLDNLAAALASVGATLDQVGALRLYIRQSHMHEGRAISAAAGEVRRQPAMLDLDRRDEPRR